MGRALTDQYMRLKGNRSIYEGAKKNSKCAY